MTVQRLRKIKRLCWCATPKRVAAKVRELLDNDENAWKTTICFERKVFGLWKACIVDGWKPPHQQTCVGKSENIAQWVETLMAKRKTKVIYISTMGAFGFHGMQYAYQEI